VAATSDEQRRRSPRRCDLLGERSTRRSPSSCTGRRPPTRFDRLCGLLFDRENISVTEAVNFGSASAAAAAVSYVGILLARRLGGVTIRGLFDHPSLREERSGRRGKTTYAISFFMPVTDDHRYRFPVVPVEFRTTRHPQFLRAGQEVVVRGRPHRGGYLVARSVRSALQA
jgi:hypothetical protein